MSHTKMTTLPFLFLVLSPFVIFDSDYALILCPLSLVEYPLEYFYDTWKKCRTGLDDVSHTRKKTLAFSLLELSPLLVFEFDFVSALQLEYPSEYFDDTL